MPTNNSRKEKFANKYTNYYSLENRIVPAYTEIYALKTSSSMSCPNIFNLEILNNQNT